MKKLLSVLVLSALPLFLVGCASSRKVEVEQMKTVRSFAITGFSARLPFSAMGSSIGTTNSPQTTEMYDATSNKLATFLKAKPMKREAMVASEGYVRSYKGTMEGFQNKGLDNSTMHYLVPQVMDNDSTRLLDTTGRDQLMNALNVDALVSLDVRVVLDGVTVMGLGSRKPQAHVLIQMYKKGVAEPVWFETLIGEASEESVGATKFINEEKLRELSLVSYKSALTKMSWEETKKN